ncbi:hypothetical protein BUB20358_06783 [Burkholderia ubonensis]|nr:hypothetical protein BUB20358_06783 [Burkholderia ubonensis]
MDRQHEQVLVGREPDHAQAQQRRRAEIERARRLVDREPLRGRRALARGQRGQVGQRERQRDGRLDDLHRVAVLDVEMRAQRLVPREQRRQRALERILGERAAPRHDVVHVVDRLPRLQLLEEPQPLLRERQRKDEHVLFGDVGLLLHGRVERVHCASLRVAAARRAR